MANYGRGWEGGYGGQSAEDMDAHADREALRDGDWEWLDRSPRQRRLRAEQGLSNNDYADE